MKICFFSLQSAFWNSGNVLLYLQSPLGGTRRVGGLLGVAGRLSGTVSPFRDERTPTPPRAARFRPGPAGLPAGSQPHWRTMHGGGSAPSCCAFTHRVAFDPRFPGPPLRRTRGPDPQPTLVFLPGESHGQRSLGHGVSKELDKT